MRLISLAPLAIEVSNAGGLGFIGAGSDLSTLENHLKHAASMQQRKPALHSTGGVLPVGVGFLLWGAKLEEALPLLEKYVPAAIWLFAPRKSEELKQWTQETRRVTKGKCKVWIQVGTVADAVDATKTCQPDVLVVQGTDAGGHGLESCAGLIPLLPEADDAVSELARTEHINKPHLVAAGGIMDGRGLAASIALGGAGCVMGTRYLASPEANIAKGYQNAVLKAADGGVNTARGKLYDSLRGTTDWPDNYGGRSVLNQSWWDAQKGMSEEENKRLYDDALKTGDEGWGDKARLTTYAGSGVGLVKDVKGAGEITKEVREDAKQILRRITSGL